MSKKSLLSFYNVYHQKNGVYSKPITENNFTYYYFIKYFKKYYKGPEDGSVLDIGCGVGSLSFYLASKGMQVRGIDVSSRAIKLCQTVKKNIGLKNVTFSRAVLDRKKEANDVVLCSEIIEHIKDDGVFLDMIHKKLSKKGFLFLSTPSSENWLYPRGFYKKFDDEVGHLRRYTKDGLKDLLEDSGFRIVTIQPIEGILRNLLFISKLGCIIRFIRGPLVPLFHIIDALFIKFFGPSNYFVVAQKK